jgi:hypothetical protein
MAQEAIPLHHAAFPEVTSPVRCVKGTVISVVEFSVLSLSLYQGFGKIRFSIGLSPIFEGSSSGMGPPAGNRENCAVVPDFPPSPYPVICGEIYVFLAVVFFPGNTAGNKSGISPLPKKTRREDPWSARVEPFPQLIKTLLKVIPGSNR